ncbi:MAG: DUF3365 domain-containing protein [Candidatus Zixiibacteriota bacterium]|nr:MAG: DUF3365 domain-containing protein [candidate division Zixibacteria bacterium]
MRSKTVVTVSIGISLILLAFSGCGESVPKDEEVAAVTRHIAGDFMDELKTELLTALEDTVAGTVGAIYVCAEKAPEISARYSSLPGITVKRTSKRLRNPNNAPDEYEMKTLEILESRPAFGSQDHYEWEITDGQKKFRFVRAINTSSVCLKCHGNPEKMEDEVKATIAEKYENDQATGFMLEDLRGILTVSLEWPEGKAVFDSISAGL